MKVSDQILECSSCKIAAKRIDPNNHQALFNDCWLKVREIEIKDANWKPDNYISFFGRMLKNKSIDANRASSLHRELNEVWKEKHREIQIKDYSFDEFLINWLDEKTDDEVTNFYREIIFLVLHNKTIKGLIKELDMEATTFYKHYKIAKQILKHDYITSTNNNIFHSDPMVQESWIAQGVTRNIRISTVHK